VARPCESFELHPMRNNTAEGLCLHELFYNCPNLGVNGELNHCPIHSPRFCSTCLKLGFLSYVIHLQHSHLIISSPQRHSSVAFGTEKWTKHLKSGIRLLKVLAGSILFCPCFVPDLLKVIWSLFCDFCTMLSVSIQICDIF
jgi:hypothetical protein